MATTFGNYSDITEVKHINYSQPRDAHIPSGIWHIKKFVSALEEIGKPIFKIRTSRFPLSNSDISDAWMDLNEYGWSIRLAIDESMIGFNEVYICKKNGQ